MIQLHRLLIALVLGVVLGSGFKHESKLISSQETPLIPAQVKETRGGSSTFGTSVGGVGAI